MSNKFFILLVVATFVGLGNLFDLGSFTNETRSIIKNRYIAVLKSNCTEEDIHYVVGTVREAQKDGVSGAGSVKNFSTHVYLTSGIMGFVFDGDVASVDKVQTVGLYNM